MEQPAPISEPPALPKPPTTSLAGRLMNIFAVPGEVFEEVKTSPGSAANWLVPALLLIAVGWVGFALAMSQDSLNHQWTEFNEKIVQKQIEKMHMPKEQIEKMRPMMEKMTGISSKVGFLAQPVMVGFVTPFWWGLIVWLLGAKAFKGNFGYMKAVEVAGLSNTLSSLETVVRILLMFFLGNIFASPSLGLLIKDFDPQNPLHIAAASVNVMQFWFLAVVSIGLAKLSNRSFAQSAACIFGIWAAYSSLIIGFQFVMQAAFSGMKGGGG